jgi:hypothetical protein
MRPVLSLKSHIAKAKEINFECNMKLIIVAYFWKSCLDLEPFFDNGLPDSSSSISRFNSFLNEFLTGLLSLFSL